MVSPPARPKPLRRGEDQAKKKMRNRSRTLNAVVYCLIALAVCLGGIAAWRRYSQRRRPDETASDPGDAGGRTDAFMPDTGFAEGLMPAGGLPLYTPSPPNGRFVCPQCQSRCLVPPGGGCPACPFCGRRMARQALTISPVGGAPAGGVGVRRWSGAGVAPPAAIGTAAIRPHGDRGICTTCHTMAVSSQGLSISLLGGVPARGVGLPIPIRPNAARPHADRGVCTNCHTVVSSAAPQPRVTLAAAALSPDPFPTQLVAAAPARPSPKPLWRGVAAPAIADVMTTRPWRGSPASPSAGSKAGWEARRAERFLSEAVKPILIKEFGIEVGPGPGSGARVSGVMGNSYAANAGLRAGDIIIECNGTRVRGVEQFQRVVSLATPEADAQIRIMRGGRGRDLLIMVGEGEMEGFTPIKRP